MKIMKIHEMKDDIKNIICSETNPIQKVKENVSIAWFIEIVLRDGPLSKLEDHPKAKGGRYLNFIN